MAEERDTEYVQVRTPDIMRISEYVIKAKGINRTMAQFAEDCGIGASTLSRIANGKISKPLSEDTVKAIYEHRAPESKILRDRLCKFGDELLEESTDLCHALSTYDDVVEQL